MASAFRTFARILDDRRATLWLALGVLTLVWLPVLIVMGGHGSWDDWWFRAAYEGLRTYGTITPADPYRFSNGDPQTFRDGIEHGFGVWFAHPEVRVALWRPLSAATHWFDHSLWGFDHHLAYLHSYLWLVLQVVAGHALFRTILRPREAGLATLVLAWASSHAEAVTWMAARNSQVAAALGTLALACHAAARRSDAPRPRWLGPLFFALALLGGETGLGTAPYLLIYELCLAPETEGEAWGPRLSRSFRALLPYGLVLVAWFVAYSVQGYGTAHSGYYINPLHEPLRFLEALPERGLTLLGGAFLATPMALWLFRPDTRTFLLCAGVASIALVLW
ncbi:MAG TPA: hypothetical protein VLC09_09730, partial [Polyangiaceae bacterium]|nr:hypothetical protein [Polyangiaceae bacterium]